MSAGLLICFTLFEDGHTTDVPWLRYLFTDHVTRARILNAMHGAPCAAYEWLERLRYKCLFATSSQVGIERDHAPLRRNIIAASHRFRRVRFNIYEEGQTIECAEKGDHIIVALSLCLVQTPSALAAVQ